MTQRKGAINFILRVLCLLLAFACATLLLWQYSVRKQGEDANEAMRQLYDPAASAEEGLPEPQASFAQLLEANPETVAYLDAAENIEFAVVQRDNEYYLTHNFFGEETPEGTAFLDEGNSVYPLDEHILIHGHNMRDGSVFGDLDRFRELDFLKENAVATFNTIYEDGLYAPLRRLRHFRHPRRPGLRGYASVQLRDGRGLFEFRLRGQGPLYLRYSRGCRAW